MLILILIDVQYLHIVSFSFKKGLNSQSHSLLDFHYSKKKLKICPIKFHISHLGDCSNSPHSSPPPVPITIYLGNTTDWGVYTFLQNFKIPYQL